MILGITEADVESTDNLAAPVTGLKEDWAALVQRIQHGEDQAMEELYWIFGKGIRFFLYRKLGPDELTDRVHDTFLIVVRAIQRGEIREPERLMGFVRTIVRRQVAASIDQVVHRRREARNFELNGLVAERSHNSEQSLEFREKVNLMTQVLRELSDKDREILDRFYLREQAAEQICSDMALTDTEFRLLKSRAKARFGELGKRKLKLESLTGLSVRRRASCHGPVI